MRAAFDGDERAGDVEECLAPETRATMHLVEAEALAVEGRHLVRRVAREQYAPNAPAFGHQAVEAIDRLALDRRMLRDAPRLQQSRDDIVVEHGGRLLARKQHELPAMASGRHVDASGRTRRIAELEVDGGQQVRGVDEGVDDQPGLVELQVIEWNFKRLANRARRAVAGNQVAGADLGAAI